MATKRQSTVQRKGNVRALPARAPRIERLTGAEVERLKRVQDGAAEGLARLQQTQQQAQQAIAQAADEEAKGRGKVELVMEELQAAYRLQAGDRVDPATGIISRAAAQPVETPAGTPAGTPSDAAQPAAAVAPEPAPESDGQATGDVPAAATPD